MMDGSEEFSLLQTRAIYGHETLKLKINKKMFRDNSKYAHLIGRAFTCEMILKRHSSDQYKSVDELLGDLQIEMVDTLNEYRLQTSYETMPKYRVEDFILQERS